MSSELLQRINFDPGRIAARVAQRRLEGLPPPVKAGEQPLTFERLETEFTFEQFSQLLQIIAKDGRRIPLRLNAAQLDYLRAGSARDVVLKGRRMGQTTVCCAQDVWAFLSKRGSSVAVVCQSSSKNDATKQLNNIFRVFFESLRSLGLDLKFEHETETEWTIPSRDAELRIVGAGASEVSAKKKGRAGGITRLHLTETAFYDYADQTLNALLECVPDQSMGNQIVSESTPNGASGYFYRQCKDAEAARSAYKFHFFPWYKTAEYKLALEPGEKTLTHPEERVQKRLDYLRRQGCFEEQIKWWLAKVADKGLDLTEQEYPSDPETCFLVAGRGFFDRAAVALLLAKAEESIEVLDRDRVRIYKRPVPGHLYVLSGDPSEGIGDGDPSGALMYDCDTAEHVATIDGYYEPHDFAAVLADLARDYNEARIAVERNNHGHAVLQALELIEHYPRIFGEKGKRGWDTNAATRPIMLDGLEAAIRDGSWTSPDRRVLAQLRTFVTSATGKPEAAPGEHDDLVIAAAIGWQIRQRPKRDWSMGDVTRRLESLAR